MPKLPKLSVILSFFALLLFAAVGYSQSAVVTSLQNSNGAGGGNGAGQNSGSISVSASPGMIGGMISGFGSVGLGGVKGQPFSADVIEEDDKYLADGNHIHREMHGKIFRDSEGRSRNEMEIGGMIAGGTPFVHITIFDPVQNVFILLDPQQKVATVSHFKGSSGMLNQPRVLQPAAGAAQPSARPATAGGKAEMQNLPVQSSHSMSQHKREDLGTMEIEGFTAKGTRITTTIPAGTRGNDKPMITTSERWVSEDLKMDLITKSTSPESGEHTRRLVNIRSGDPDPLLFQAPADYTVKEQPQQ